MALVSFTVIKVDLVMELLIMGADRLLVWTRSSGNLMSHLTLEKTDSFYYCIHPNPRYCLGCIIYALPSFKHLFKGKERNFTLSRQCYFCHCFQIYTKTGQRLAVISQWIFSLISVFFVFFSCFWFISMFSMPRGSAVRKTHISFKNNTVVRVSETSVFPIK